MTFGYGYFTEFDCQIHKRHIILERCQKRIVLQREVL